MDGKEYSLENDELLKKDYEGPKVLVSFAVMGQYVPEFYNVILNTGMPRTNKALEIIKRGMGNHVSSNRLACHPLPFFGQGFTALRPQRLLLF
jgi:hypothetical protein